MATVFLGVGSNIDPEENIRSGLTALKKYFGPLELSPVYRSLAVGFEGPDFLNLVVSFHSPLSPREIVNACKGIEQQHQRDPDAPSFSDRTLDMDLLLYDDWVMDEPGIKLPRDEIERYAFVLRPLSELAPERLHPVTGLSLARMWEEFPGKQSQKLEQVALTIE
ncbi:MAG: 2-amino-4-hydroxy-6-hydroxymethyldihydropteridine diphosphokinase [Gammaproteobacteria bacterium]|nr:MAG: 2-amino-4-hydroxy-6-hydroxymethyldihydropteridine diphosphokinase [Gammaproteobacteria bacterium]